MRIKRYMLINVDRSTVGFTYHKWVARLWAYRHRNENAMVIDRGERYT